LALAAEGGVSPADAVRTARDFLAKLGPENSVGDMLLEIEIDRIDELDAVLAAGPDIVLLDNMTPDVLQDAVARRNRLAAHIELEASGGLSLATVGEIARTGVERISVGGLTHSASWLDLGLDWQSPHNR
jgi:nicotinate-nucleotide pyrophosphorylase (carboxylating)